MVEAPPQSGGPIGVLALQGGFAAHAAALEGLGLRARLVRRASECEGLGGLVLPGGESTTMLRLMDAPLRRALIGVFDRGVPVLATCAGLILAARSVTPRQACFGWLDVDVKRMGWGRQLDSAETTSDQGRDVVLIRAPRIERVGGATVVDTLRGEPILVRRGSVWGATFHPELSASRSTRALHADVFLRSSSNDGARDAPRDG